MKHRIEEKSGIFVIVQTEFPFGEVGPDYDTRELAEAQLRRLDADDALEVLESGLLGPFDHVGPTEPIDAHAGEDNADIEYLKRDTVILTGHEEDN